MIFGVRGPALCRDMPCLVHYLFLFLPLSMCMVSIVDSDGKKLPPMYWNSSNPIFNQPNSQININLQDSIDFICPYYDSSSTQSWEYYVVYIVSEDEYNKCRLYNPINATLVLNCAKPTEYTYFTLWVLRFQVIPPMPDFPPGKYYIISTSTGTSSGLGNQVGGVCNSHNMRLMMEVSEMGTQHTQSTPNPQNQTVQTTSTTTRQTTNKPVTSHPTTKPPTTTSTTPKPTTTPEPQTTRFPGGTPVDPSKENVIDATGQDKNTGTINSGRTTLTVSYELLLSTTILFILLLR